MFVDAKCKENRLEEIPTTEQAENAPYPFDKGKPILPKVSQLRRKLAEKAKREPRFRFYALYDRIYRKDVLWSAWCIVQRNDGGPGIDGQTIEEVEQYGAIRLIDEIHELLQSKTYQRGTPQGGVISPLLANLYLHWFDKVFHGKDSPLKFANARLVRFADDFVIMARSIDDRMIKWVVEKIEMWMGLELNREKTKVVNVRSPDAALKFLGYSFRYEKDAYKKNSCYLRRSPSRKSMQRARDRIRELTSHQKGCFPINEVVRELNWFLIGWSNYFKTGHPGRSFRSLNHFVLTRMYLFLRRKSQRPFKLPEGITWYHFIFKKLMVRRL